MELFPEVFSNPKVTYLIDIDGNEVLNTINDKLDKQVELDYVDAYYLALIPFFRNEKSRKDMLNDMAYFINQIGISEELKFLIKLVQILSARALSDDEQEEILGVIKMGSTYIDNYERNLIKNAIKEVVLKMKELGVDSEIIFECTGFKL